MDIFIYFFLLGFLLLLGIDYLAAKSTGQSFEKGSTFLAISVLGFFMAVRANQVGTDTKFYAEAFRQIRNMNLWEALSRKVYLDPRGLYEVDLEPGYRLMVKLFSDISSDPQILTAGVSVILLAGLYFVIKKGSPYPFLSVWLYFTMGLFQTQMNVSRNSIAIFLSYLVILQIHQCSFKKYLAVILLASLFHMSALAFIPLYFVIRYVKLSKRNVLWILAAFSVSSMNLPIVYGIMARLMPASIASHFISRTKGYESLVLGAFHLLVFVTVILFIKRKKRWAAFAKYETGSWMLLLNMGFFILGMNLSAGARMAALFGPYLILYIPQLLTMVHGKKRRAIAIGVLFAVTTAAYIARMFVNNIGGSVPYAFFWDS